MTTVRSLLLLLAALFCSAAIGCFSFSPAKGPGPRVGSRAEDLPWAVPDPALLEPIKEATPEKVFRARLLAGKSAEDISEPAIRALVEHPRLTVTRNEIVDGSLVRMFRSEDGELDLTTLLTGFIPNGRVLSTRDVAPARQKLAVARADRMNKRLNALWAKHGVEADPTDDHIALDRGIAFRVPEKVPERCRGVIVHLWALAGNEYECKVAETLAARGWFIVDVKPGTAAPSEVRPEVVDQILILEDEQTRLSGELPTMDKRESTAQYQKRVMNSPAYRRQREIGKQIADLRNPPVRLCDSADVAAAAAELGTRIDAALVDNARAAEAALETAYRIHPSLRAMPVVVVGFSAGAISTPTVAALLSPDAVVIIGGAANAVGIAMQSELSHGGVRVMCEGKPAHPELVRELTEAYLGSGKFDPYHAAPVLEGIPVLVVDAGMDTWVPSDLGEVLYHRLGKPDRLHMALGGHGMLFYFLPGRAKWIADWIERAIPDAGVYTR